MIEFLEYMHSGGFGHWLANMLTIWFLTCMAMLVVSNIRLADVHVQTKED